MAIDSALVRSIISVESYRAFFGGFSERGSGFQSHLVV